MAYFPNGTAGMIYEENVCAHCVHNKPDDGGCAVWAAHMHYNYERTKNEAIRHVLDMLIPMHSDGVTAADCAMFHSADPNRCTDTPDMFATTNTDGVVE